MLRIRLVTLGLIGRVEAFVAEQREELAGQHPPIDHNDSEEKPNHRRERNSRKGSTSLMRRVLYCMVMQLALLSAAEAQVPFANGTTDFPRVFEYPLPHQRVILEFNQDECQASVAEEYVIPDVPANPGSVTLTMLFNAACDLGLSTADTVPPAHGAPREIIEEFLISPDSLRMLVKFNK